jgi:hypothetical protein
VKGNECIDLLDSEDDITDFKQLKDNSENVNLQSLIASNLKNERL